MVLLQNLRIAEIQLFQKLEIAGSQLIAMLHNAKTVSITAKATSKKRRMVFCYEGADRNILGVNTQRCKFLWTYYLVGNIEGTDPVRERQAVWYSGSAGFGLRAHTFC